MIIKFHISGEMGEVGLPGLKGFPGDSGPCMYQIRIKKNRFKQYSTQYFRWS